MFLPWYTFGSTIKVLPYNYGGKFMRRRSSWKRGSERGSSEKISGLRSEEHLEFSQ